jgi:hypothetical protein
MNQTNDIVREHLEQHFVDLSDLGSAADCLAELGASSAKMPIRRMRRGRSAGRALAQRNEKASQLKGGKRAGANYDGRAAFSRNEAARQGAREESEEGEMKLRHAAAIASPQRSRNDAV